MHWIRYSKPSRYACALLFVCGCGVLHDDNPGGLDATPDGHVVASDGGGAEPTVLTCLTSPHATVEDLGPPIELFRALDPPSILTAAIHGALPQVVVRIYEPLSRRTHELVVLLADPATPIILASRTRDDLLSGRLFGTSWGYVEARCFGECSLRALDDRLDELTAPRTWGRIDAAAHVRYGQHEVGSLEIRSDRDVVTWSLGTPDLDATHRLTVPDLELGDGVMTPGGWYGAAVVDGRGRWIRLVDGRTSESAMDAVAEPRGAWAIPRPWGARVFVGTSDGLADFRLDRAETSEGPALGIASPAHPSSVESGEAILGVPDGAVVVSAGALVVLPDEDGGVVAHIVPSEGRRVEIAALRPGSSFGAVITRRQDARVGDYVVEVVGVECTD